MIGLRCPVRACGRPLERVDGALECAARHRFDLARSGYANLLQPQDRKSSDPGDRIASVDARRRLADAGVFDSLARAIAAELENIALPDTPVVLDIGCGEGFHLRSLAKSRPIDGCGIDLSRHAIDLAARAAPSIIWVVANADRGLPLDDASIDLILSIDARFPASEIARVLRPDGALIVAVPDEDDLAELRASVLGAAHARDRAARVLRESAGLFELRKRSSVRESIEVPPDRAADLLLSTYRGARESQRSRAESIGTMRVTMSHVILVMAR